MSLVAIVVIALLSFAFGRSVGEDGMGKLKKKVRDLESRCVVLQYEILVLRSMVFGADSHDQHDDTRYNSSNQRPWRIVLGFRNSRSISAEDIKRRYTELAKTRHPDRGGSTAAMAELNVAKQQALREVA